MVKSVCVGNGKAGYDSSSRAHHKRHAKAVGEEERLPSVQEEEVNEEDTS